MDKNATKQKNISYKGTTIGTRASSIACPTDCGFLVGKKKAWRMKNPDKHHAQQKRYSIKHKKEISERLRVWKKNNPEKIRQYRKDYEKKYPKKIELKNFKAKTIFSKKINFSFQEFNTLLEKQKNLCAICGNGEKTRALSIDHCHKTKKVRGLLCKKCNTAIGMLNDNPELVLSAYNYLQNGKK